MNNMDYFTFAAEKEDVGTRIDVFLAENMEDLSRSGVQKLIDEGMITEQEALLQIERHWKSPRCHALSRRYQTVS